MGEYCTARIASWSPAGIGGESGRKKSSIQTHIDHGDKPTYAPVSNVLETRSAKNVAEF